MNKMRKKKKEKERREKVGEHVEVLGIECS